MTPRMAAHQASLSITSSWSLIKLKSIKSVMPSNHLHPPLSLAPPAFNLSQQQGLFQWVSSLYHVAKVLGLCLQHQSFQWTFRTDFLYNWLVWSPCSPRDPQESSPTPQFKSINSLALSFLYGPTLTSIHDYWKNHSLDYWVTSVQKPSLTLFFHKLYQISIMFSCAWLSKFIQNLGVPWWPSGYDSRLLLLWPWVWSRQVTEILLVSGVANKKKKNNYPESDHFLVLS